jgi:hypothetical protein
MYEDGEGAVVSMFTVVEVDGEPLIRDHYFNGTE